MYFQYAIPERLDVISLSCVCAEVCREVYEPIFNSVAKSVKRDGDKG